MQNKLLAELLSIQGDHQNEDAMIDYVIDYIDKIKGVVYEMDEHGNIIVTKRTSDNVEFLPAVACHLDTIHKFDEKYQALFFDDMFFTAPNCKAGIGGDDRCGIFIALTLLNDLPNLKAFFFTGEEVGCIGSNAIDLKYFDECRFCIEPDRKDSTDLISTYGGQNTGGVDFMALLDTARKMGFTDCAGVYTDVMTLLDRGLEISVLNISCGYYKAHTQYEYIVQSETLHTLETVRQIILDSKDMIYFNDRVEEVYKYDYRKPYKSTSYDGAYSYEDYGDDWGDYGRIADFSAKPADANTEFCGWCYTKHNRADLKPYKSYRVCKDCLPYTKNYKKDLLTNQ